MTDRQKQFNIIAEEWRQATWMHSLWTPVRRHPKTQELMDFGKEAIPYILELMKTDVSIYWSMMLEELTGETPDYEPLIEDGWIKHSVLLFNQAWLKWGKENGYLQ